ncbi:helix-turn-helix domain-containing protein [Georgenia satyanarayanai]|uniref:helix-turn-helix domain-containing protein n=1 Tax=Georgenia satyanarayanai TaxID=860221 RepID=UPI000DA13F4F|nr:helix-turn-helix domain-containing protein [Georgenia satyanarayanai]
MDARLAVPRDTHDVVAELPGVWLGHSAHPSSGTPRHHRSDVTYPCSSPQGRTGGRPRVMDPDKLAAARARRANGESPSQIARALGVSRATVYRYLATDQTDDQ